MEVEEQPSQDTSPGERATGKYIVRPRSSAHTRRIIVIVVVSLLNLGLLALLGSQVLTPAQITYPNVVDATGSTAIDYGVTGVPETVFINRHGVIVSKVIGELTKQTIQ